jgi:putative Mg2+ transporter-C (MgtC) family protein
MAHLDHGLQALSFSRQEENCEEQDWYDFIHNSDIYFSYSVMADSELLTKLIISIVIGVILGGEREYRNKSAGLRTIVLICLGSTVFAVLSKAIGDDSGGSRIAANIVTGIGFLGAGAIMREGLTISGVTTAGTIWVAAALGLAVGLGHYAFAFYAVALCFVVLTFFGYIQAFLFSFLNRTIQLHVVFDVSAIKIELIEAQMSMLRLKFSRKKEMRMGSDSIYHYDVIGKDVNLARLATFLNENQYVKSFEY